MKEINGHMSCSAGIQYFSIAISLRKSAKYTLTPGSAMIRKVDKEDARKSRPELLSLLRSGMKICTVAK
jgi:hypothetical protein